MWEKIKAFFFGSETIFWARLQVFLGAGATALTYVPPEVLTPIIPDKWFPLFLVFNGLATEYLRRRRDPAFHARSGS